MQRSVAVVLALMLAVGGCTSASGGKLGTVLGAGVIGVGVMMKTGAFGHGGETDPADVAWMPMTLGALIALPSLYVWLTHLEHDEPQRSLEVAPPDPKIAVREQAWQLTKQAASAARSGDCATVARLDVELRALDADFHDTVFARDVAIAHCLASSH